MWASRRLNRPLAPPDWLSVNVTLRCNLSCVMCTTCYDTPELSTQELLDLVDQAASWGVRVFNPLGGEPFVRQDLEDVLAHAARRDLFTTLTTNGTLISAARAARLAKIPAEKLHVNVSIDGLRATHDGVRGKGAFERMLAGYRRLREADAAAGNPTRKICANAILHANNVDEYLALADFLAAEGFSGLQVLHLFRNRDDDTVGGMWFSANDAPKLEAVCRALAEHPFVLNRDALPLVPRYYREGVGPLEAPCWAGFKELYVNADGSAIMCDGKLDFLAGRFGSVRERTLRELWASPELAARREVVKTCTTPCIQSCYLRKESDSGVVIAKGLVANAARPARARAARVLPARTVDGTLTLELSDVPDDPMHARTRALFAGSPITLADLHADPDRFAEARDRRYLDFGRGFMGADLVAHVRDALREARLRFRAVSLSWRGEPLLHPELPRIAEAVAGISEHVELATTGALLRREIAPALADWKVHLVGVPERYADRILREARIFGATLGPPPMLVLRPAISWDGHLTASVADVALARRVGDVLKEPLGAIWARVPAE